MLEILRLNFINLIKKYDKYQAKKRVKAISKVRRHLAKKFTKIFKTNKSLVFNSCGF